jgi:CRP-like cAMP-binding protein
VTPAELAQIPFFEQLTSDERDRLAHCARREVAPAGLMITTFGERGDELYVIEEGRAYVSVEAQRLAELGPGDIFGEIALLGDDWRSASVLAATSMRYVILTSCAELMSDNPRLAERLFGMARERLARTPE